MADRGDLDRRRAPPRPGGSPARGSARGGRANAGRPGAGGRERPSESLPLTLHQPRHPGRGGPAEPGGTRRATDPGGDRRGRAARPGSRGHSLVARQGRPDLSRPRRQVSRRRGSRRGRQARRDAPPEPPRDDGGADQETRAGVPGDVAGLDRAVAVERRPAPGEHRGRALRRTARPSVHASPSAPRVRRRDRRDPAARRRHPVDRALARRRRLGGAARDALDPDPEPLFDDRARTRHRLRAPDGQPLPGGARGRARRNRSGGGRGASRGLDHSPLRFPGLDQLRRAPDDSALRATLRGIRRADGHRLRAVAVRDAVARGALAPRAPHRSASGAAGAAGARGRWLRGLEALGSTRHRTSRAVPRARERAAAAARRAGAPARYGPAVGRLAPEGIGIRSRVPRARRRWDARI